LFTPNRLTSLCTLLLLWLSACSSFADARTDNNNLEPTTIPSTMSPVTIIQTATLAISPTATATFTPTPTVTPAQSATPAATSSPTPLACLMEDGRIETASLSTELLRLPLDFRVYLPPCYDLQDNRTYPVLYLIHGQSYKDDQWERLGAGATADALISRGDTVPFIIVMPYDRYGDKSSENMFAQAVVENLIPWIDDTYRTVPEREHRAVGGLSRGAGWAVHLGISNWEMFGALGAHSLAVLHADAKYMRTWLDDIPQESYPRIYIDIGDNDSPSIMESAIWFETLLNQKSIPHEWHLFTGYHNEEYWQTHLDGYLRWYAQEW